jgi:hypothetical protein
MFMKAGGKPLGFFHTNGELQEKSQQHLCAGQHPERIPSGFPNGSERESSSAWNVVEDASSIEGWLLSDIQFDFVVRMDVPDFLPSLVHRSITSFVATEFRCLLRGQIESNRIESNPIRIQFESNVVCEQEQERTYCVDRNSTRNLRALSERAAGLASAVATAYDTVCFLDRWERTNERNPSLSAPPSSARRAGCRRRTEE